MTDQSFRIFLVLTLSALLVFSPCEAAESAEIQATIFDDSQLEIVNDSLILDDSAILIETAANKTSSPRHCSDEYFNGRQIIAPAILIGVGSLGTFWKPFKDLNKEVKKGMTDLRGDHYIHADDYIQLLPAAVYFGLGFTGVKTKHTFRQRLAVEITSYLAMAVLTNGIKYTVREMRPDNSKRNSFPSGHTATAFVGAELIREEYGNWWGAGAYVVSTGVAFLRMYNNRHWLNDVIAGAGIGILSARIGYWMLPLYNKWFHWKDKPNNPIVTIAPQYDPITRSGGIGMAIVF